MVHQEREAFRALPGCTSYLVSVARCAKAVVKHLDGDQYPHGHTRLLEILKSSLCSVCQLLIFFKGLDAWHQLKRGPIESVAELLVCDENFLCSCNKRYPGPGQIGPLEPQLLEFCLAQHVPRRTTADPGGPSVTPAFTPSGSPMWGVRAATATDGQTARLLTSSLTSSPKVVSMVQDFLEDQLRRSIRLKNATFIQHAHQNVLTQTGNSTSFLQVRRALRSFHSEEDEARKGGRPPRMCGKVKTRMHSRMTCRHGMSAIQGHWIGKMISNGFQIPSILIGRHGRMRMLFGRNPLMRAGKREHEHHGGIQPADDSQGPGEQQYKETYALGVSRKSSQDSGRS